MALEALIRGIWNWRWRQLLAALLLYASLAMLVWFWPRSFVAQMVLAPAETTAMATSTLLTPVPMLQPALLDSRPGGNFGVYLGTLRSMEAARMLAAQTPILAQMTERRGSGLPGRLRRLFDLRIAADADRRCGFVKDDAASGEANGERAETAEPGADGDAGAAALLGCSDGVSMPLGVDGAFLLAVYEKHADGGAAPLTLTRTRAVMETARAALTPHVDGLGNVALLPQPPGALPVK